MRPWIVFSKATRRWCKRSNQNFRKLLEAFCSLSHYMFFVLVGLFLNKIKYLIWAKAHQSNLRCSLWYLKNDHKWVGDKWKKAKWDFKFRHIFAQILSVYLDLHICLFYQDTMSTLMNASCKNDIERMIQRRWLNYIWTYYFYAEILCSL